MSQDFNNQFITNHFYQTEKFINELYFLLENKKAASNYLKPTRTQGKKILVIGVICLVIFIIGLLYYTSLFIYLPQYFMHIVFLSPIAISTPIFLIKLIARHSTSIKQDRLKIFIERNDFHKNLPTPITIRNRYFENFRKELSIGEYNRIESYLLHGKDLYHQDYYRRDRFLLLKRVFFLPIIDLRLNNQEINISKQITSYAFLAIGRVYIKLYKRFRKTTLFFFYFIFQTNSKEDASNKNHVPKDSIEQKESTPFDLTKDELTKGLKKEHYPIFADGTDEREIWSEYIKAWLYNSWKIKLNNDSNKSDNQKKREILDEFQKEFGALTDNEAPGMSTILRTYNKYKSKN